MGIKVAVCEQDQSSQGFVIAFKHYDFNKQGQIGTEGYGFFTGNVQPTGSLSLTVFRADGTVENIGNVGNE
jgi:hypothetical protein